MPANPYSRAWPAPTGARPKVFRTSGKIIVVCNGNWNKWIQDV